MKFLIQFGWLMVVSLACAGASLTLESSQPPQAANQVSWGKYLVEEIAKCTECHTPRDQSNLLDRDRWLQGAPIWIRPVVPTPNWADMAPALASLSNYTDAQVERVLEKGVGVTNGPIQPPMHIYHMHHADSAAIIAYLRSLKGPR
jgi:mono/diheme cytochrome c family protein